LTPSYSNGAPPAPRPRLVHSRIATPSSATTLRNSECTSANEARYACQYRRAPSRPRCGSASVGPLSSASSANSETMPSASFCSSRRCSAAMNVSGCGEAMRTSGSDPPNVRGPPRARGVPGQASGRRRPEPLPAPRPARSLASAIPQPPKRAVQRALELPGRAVPRLLDGRRLVAHRDRLQPGEARLEQSALVVRAALDGVVVAQVDLDPRDPPGEAPQRLAQRGLHALGQRGAPLDVAIGVDLHQHVRSAPDPVAKDRGCARPAGVAWA